MCNAITIRGADYIITSESWWMDAPIENKFLDAPEVARVHAISASKKYYKYKIDASGRQVTTSPNGNPYYSDENGDGNPVSVMLSLTDANLIEYGLTPKSQRPATHGKVIVSAEQYSKFIDNLQNEGHVDQKFVDSTPWQKGDDQPY